MKVGFSGTRDGMTPEQAGQFGSVIEGFAVDVFNHGDCVGADNQAANIVYLTDRGGVRIVSHPPSEKKYRAFNVHFSEVLPVANYLERNRRIVDVSELVIIAPLQMQEQQRGGTWYTYRYARKMKRDVYVIWPDGTMKCYFGGEE